MHQSAAGSTGRRQGSSTGSPVPSSPISRSLALHRTRYLQKSVEAISGRPGERSHLAGVQLAWDEGNEPHVCDLLYASEESVM
jgi:hypothetical protein